MFRHIILLRGGALGFCWTKIFYNQFSKLTQKDFKHHLCQSRQDRPYVLFSAFCSSKNSCIFMSSTIIVHYKQDTMKSLTSSYIVFFKIRSLFNRYRETLRWYTAKKSYVDVINMVTCENLPLISWNQCKYYCKQRCYSEECLYICWISTDLQSACARWLQPQADLGETHRWVTHAVICKIVCTTGGSHGSQRVKALVRKNESVLLQQIWRDYMNAYMYINILKISARDYKYNSVH